MRNGDFINVDKGWPPLISPLEFWETRHGKDYLYEELIDEGYEHNIMKTFEETRYA